MRGPGHAHHVASPVQHASHGAARPEPEPSVTVFFISRRTSGVARRMDSLIAHLQTRERRRARILKLDADADAHLLARLGVTEVPAIVVVKDRRVVGRLYGQATMPEIDRVVRPHLDPLPDVHPDHGHPQAAPAPAAPAPAPEPAATEV